MTKPAQRILVWQWGRRGAGPRIAVDLADGLGRIEGKHVLLCLSDRAEILRSHDAPAAVVKVPTYGSFWGLLGRLVTSPWLGLRLTRIVRDFRPDLTICAMPGPLDLLMVQVLKRFGTKIVVIVHDAHPHPGDGYPFQATLQNALIRQADQIVTLSRHVAEAMMAGDPAPDRPVMAFAHPPFIGASSTNPFAHDGPPRLLMFGRLLPYKGLDLLAQALPCLAHPFECRVVGEGPDSPELRMLSAIRHVTVENRWVPEDELPGLVEWADIVVLPYREASQSGVGAMAIASGRHVVATRVGGLVEQFSADTQAVLCEPDPASIANALSTVLKAPPAMRPRVDRRHEWEKLARAILAGTGTA
ncbi:glycosyltransferase family 4 protein [Gluconobacter kanchanaburiensis]|uniref:Glycosyl transferase family 1 n=1 Tax=Gluconobacter kanchanaburiensis NBRC 103587 TaxID=1307948 RepID=A0A511B8E2_9PROT|nr:glycosyltransferase family 4 protein [Gluconobacter kanchanaburiensis]MBF0862578.1 glycosyltransferase family 4 protein [Gluconobacter kanchanaburiensis]GBR71630.1 lipopolysaccharide core biosynthesis mannosyltransferase [Gluconobacter kanchanaburiensis NBRC 103587]GEK96700.1 glycosyl transferase family 1 [Gluconobacter kanchanaburiensis NBRC 103587]